MIQKETKVVRATCDGCQRSLIDPKEPHNVNYGVLQTCFGYGSRLDDVGHPTQHQLCEDCWEKALAAVGIQEGE